MSVHALRFEAGDASIGEAEARNRYARSVELAGHRVLGVVHLGHVLRIVARKEALAHHGLDPRLLARMDLSAYRGYRSRLDACVRQCENPLLVFCSNEYHRYAPSWVKAVRPRDVCAFVETPPGDPQPLLDDTAGTEERWQWLADRLRAVDVRRITLVGEAAFTYDSGLDKRGCVWEAKHQLDVYFETEILHHLTYPDVDVPRAEW
jgi:hypothetical protein